MKEDREIQRLSATESNALMAWLVKNQEFLQQNSYNYSSAAILAMKELEMPRVTPWNVRYIIESKFGRAGLCDNPKKHTESEIQQHYEQRNPDKNLSESVQKGTDGSKSSDSKQLAVIQRQLQEILATVGPLSTSAQVSGHSLRTQQVIREALDASEARISKRIESLENVLEQIMDVLTSSKSTTETVG